jgi:hypothetical protein
MATATEEPELRRLSCLLVDLVADRYEIGSLGYRTVWADAVDAKIPATFQKKAWYYRPANRAAIAAHYRLKRLPPPARASLLTEPIEASG